MKNILIIILMLFIQIVNSQDKISDVSKYEVIYNLSYQKDSTDINSKNDEKMILLIGNEYSLFESLNGRFNDSIARSMDESGIDIQIALQKIKSSRKKSRFNFRILKMTNITYVYDSYFSNNFIYTENESMNWELSKDNDTISGYSCDIAYINYAGRRYKAWYTTNIPISDGPYKFKGLPGLIVKIQDADNQYIFELISFKEKLIDFEFDSKSGIKTSKKDFYEAYNSFKKNFINQLSQQGVDIVSDDKRNLKKRVQKSRNNEIEIKY